MNFEIQKIKLDLKVNWKIARNESLFKENFIVKLKMPEGIFMGEVAPNVRYGENEAVILNNFSKLKNENDPHELFKNLDSLHFSHAFRFGVESALIRYFAFKENKSVSEYLGLSEKRKVKTSFSIPIMEINKIKDYVKALSRFHFLKLKINTENAHSLTAEVLKYMAPHQRLRIDGNETFKSAEACSFYLNDFKNAPIDLIEEPLPASSFSEYQKLKPLSPFPLMADESIESEGDFKKLSSVFTFINVKLMKAGGLINAKYLLNEAHKYQMQTMLGCMIETSLGIRDALYLSSICDIFDLDGSLLIKEDPFSFITEKDGEIFY